MKTFHCDVCGRLVFFENTSCLHCNHVLGFIPEELDLCSFEDDADGTLRSLAPHAAGRTFRRCSNAVEHGVCNWMVADDDPNPFCVSCRLNDVIPDLAVPGNRDRWHRIELAKRRLIYTLLKLRLPLEGSPFENKTGLRFRFLGDTPGAPAVLTGHEDGVITLNIAEADDEVREQRRVQFREPLRTLVGHFRHEAAHYYWDRLIAGTEWLPRFRELFGSEDADYQESLKTYYERGAPPDWLQHNVSSYASAHPWEDWAETTAHYFNIVDSLETASAFGVMSRPVHPAADTMAINPCEATDPDATFDDLLHTWFALTYVLNSLNRGAGLPDLYPFVLSPTAVEKLRFIHEVFEHARTRQPA